MEQKIKTFDQIMMGTSGPPDLMIRTGGDKRMSDFMLYQSAYTELFFLDKYLPEITTRDLEDILKQYHARKKNFGK